MIGRDEMKDLLKELQCSISSFKKSRDYAVKLTSFETGMTWQQSRLSESSGIS